MVIMKEILWRFSKWSYTSGTSKYDCGCRIHVKCSNEINLMLLLFLLTTSGFDSHGQRVSEPLIFSSNQDDSYSQSTKHESSCISYYLKYYNSFNFLPRSHAPLLPSTISKKNNIADTSKRNIQSTLSLSFFSLLENYENNSIFSVIIWALTIFLSFFPPTNQHRHIAWRPKLLKMTIKKKIATDRSQENQFSLFLVHVSSVKNLKSYIHVCCITTKLHLFCHREEYIWNIVDLQSARILRKRKKEKRKKSARRNHIFHSLETIEHHKAQATSW